MNIHEIAKAIDALKGCVRFKKLEDIASATLGVYPEWTRGGCLDSA
ncbi:MAG: hypothetical protein IH908_14900 [Proteobacteria bacterium]|nr:hypothetical protein [Pseudomonadota bacterium]